MPFFTCAVDTYLLEEVLETGKVEAQITKCIVLGVAGAGKSNVICLLLNRPPPPKRISTDAIEQALRVTSCVKFATPGITGEDSDEWVEVDGKEMRKRIANAISEKMKDVGEKPDKDDAGKEDAGKKEESDAGKNDVGIKPDNEDTGKTPPDINSDTGATLSSSDVLAPDHSSAPVLEKAKPASDLRSKVKEDIVKQIQEASAGGKPLERNWIYIVDSGGQIEFLDILPAFVKNTSVCVFVLNL